MLQSGAREPLHRVGLELVRPVRGDAGLDLGMVVLINQRRDLADFVDAGDGGGLRDRHHQLERGADGAETIGKLRPKRVLTQPFARRDADGRGVLFAVLG